jgi:hypothetical protein
MNIRKLFGEIPFFTDFAYTTTFFSHLIHHPP